MMIERATAAVRQSERWRRDVATRRLWVFARGMIAGIALVLATFVVGVGCVGQGQQSPSVRLTPAEARSLIATGKLVVLIEAIAAEGATPERVAEFKTQTDNLLDRVILPEYVASIRSARDDALEYLREPDARPWRAVANGLLDAVDAYLAALESQP